VSPTGRGGGVDDNAPVGDLLYGAEEEFHLRSGVKLTDDVAQMPKLRLFIGCAGELLDDIVPDALVRWGESAMGGRKKFRERLERRYSGGNRGHSGDAVASSMQERDRTRQACGSAVEGMRSGKR